MSTRLDARADFARAAAISRRTPGKGGFEIVSFSDCAVLTVTNETSGVNNGDGSEHSITLEFEAGGDFEILVPGCKPFETQKLAIRFRGDAEARVMQQAAQHISQFFLKHNFHESS